MKTWSVSQSGKPEDVIKAVEESPDCPEAIKDCVSALIPSDVQRASVVSSGSLDTPESHVSISISFARQQSLEPNS